MAKRDYRFVHVLLFLVCAAVTSESFAVTPYCFPDRTCPAANEYMIISYHPDKTSALAALFHDIDLAGGAWVNSQPLCGTGNGAAFYNGSYTGPTCSTWCTKIYQEWCGAYPTAITCTNGKQFSTSTGTCVCPSGTEWNGTECSAQCQPETCGLNEHWDESACMCVFDDCSTEASWRDAEAFVAVGANLCVKGCFFTAVTAVVLSPEGTPTEGTQLKPAGTACEMAVIPDLQGVPDPDQCISDDEFSLCIDGKGPTNCGEFNGEFVCIPSMDNDTCLTTPKGAIVCVGSGQPDSGWEGTPENPTAVPPPSLVWEGVPAPLNWWAPDGYVEPPGRVWPPGPQTGGRILPGGGGGGDDDDDGWGDGDESADPDMVLIDPASLIQEHDEPEGGPLGAMEWGIPSDASCPAPTAWTFMGSVVEIDYEPVCDLFNLLRPFVIALGAMTALYMLVTMGR